MTTIDTPEGIKAFALMQVVSRLKLELTGLKFKGPATSTIARAHYKDFLSDEAKKQSRKGKEKMLEELTALKDRVVAHEFDAADLP
jgi:hypothetical protein